jgi:glycosyltransferase involved in cell wall biosynthesis
VLRPSKPACDLTLFPRGLVLIRICHLISGLDVGGAERALVNLTQNLDRSRFSNEVVSLIEPGVFGNSLREAGIPVLSLGMRRGQPALRGLAKFVRHLHRSRPTVLQTWLSHADLLGTIAHRFAPPSRLLWNIRCTDMATSPGSTRLRRITRLLAHLSHRPDAVIVNSKPGKIFHEKLGYRPRRWIELPNGVDTERFCPRLELKEQLRASLGIHTRGPVIGMVARYHPMKDHATFLRAAAEFSRDHREARFVLCGTNCDDQNDNLNRLISDAGLGERVILLGVRDDMEKVYPAFDLATLCSTFGEGFPNTLIEAMACGVPCVATDIGASPEIIKDAGIAVAPRDSTALVKAWTSLLAEPGEVLAAKVRARVVEHYPIDRMCQLYEAAYVDVVCPAVVAKGPRSAPAQARDAILRCGTNRVAD